MTVGAARCGVRITQPSERANYEWLVRVIGASCHSRWLLRPAGFRRALVLSALDKPACDRETAVIVRVRGFMPDRLRRGSRQARTWGLLVLGALLMWMAAAPPARANDGPAGFWYGSDSWPVPVSGSGPYYEPRIGGSYGGYVGMTGSWAWWAGCRGAFLAWSSTNSQQANMNLHRYGRGIGTGVYWFMGGPGVDLAYNGTTAEAYAWGQRQAARTLADIARQPVAYRVVFMDIELPGIAPAPDNGWNAVYTSPCSGRVKSSFIAPAVDRADFNGFFDYLTRHSSYLPGVYSSPGVWASIFGSGSAAAIPHTYEWTYEPETVNFGQAPLGWCLRGGSCAQFFGGVTSSTPQAVMWQWSGGGGQSNGIGDFDQIDASLIH
jgi:hypothetical protein